VGVEVGPEEREWGGPCPPSPSLPSERLSVAQEGSQCPAGSFPSWCLPPLLLPSDPKGGRGLAWPSGLTSLSTLAEDGRRYRGVASSDSVGWRGYHRQGFRYQLCISKRLMKPMPSQGVAQRTKQRRSATVQTGTDVLGRSAHGFRLMS
jgi:hypothetical protein